MNLLIAAMLLGVVIVLGQIALALGDLVTTLRLMDVACP